MIGDVLDDILGDDIRCAIEYSPEGHDLGDGVCLREIEVGDDGGVEKGEVESFDGRVERHHYMCVGCHAERDEFESMIDHINTEHNNDA